MAHASNTPMLNLAASFLYKWAVRRAVVVLQLPLALLLELAQLRRHRIFTTCCSNSNHSTGVPSLLSRKQPPLASTNEKRKVARIFLLRGNATSSDCASSRCCFGGKQDLSLQDYIECSLMLQYNNSYNNY